MRLKSSWLSIGFGVCAGAAFAQGATGWEDVVAAAKKEGKLTFYSTSVGVPDYVAVTKNFEKNMAFRYKFWRDAAARYANAFEWNYQPASPPQTSSTMAKGRWKNTNWKVRLSPWAPHRS